MSNSNPPKSDLEKRLRSIVEAIELNTRNDNSNTFAVEEIKAAIKDAGYISPEELKDIHKGVTLTYMTGQEFYARFEKELLTIAPTTIEDWEFSGQEIKEAAKRAAGIKEKT